MQTMEGLNQVQLGSTVGLINLSVVHKLFPGSAGGPPALSAKRENGLACCARLCGRAARAPREELSICPPSELKTNPAPWDHGQGVLLVLAAR